MAAPSIASTGTTFDSPPRSSHPRQHEVESGAMVRVRRGPEPTLMAVKDRLTDRYGTCAEAPKYRTRDWKSSIPAREAWVAGTKAQGLSTVPPRLPTLPPNSVTMPNRMSGVAILPAGSPIAVCDRALRRRGPGAREPIGYRLPGEHATARAPVFRRDPKGHPTAALMSDSCGNRSPVAPRLECTRRTRQPEARATLQGPCNLRERRETAYRLAFALR